MVAKLEGIVNSTPVVFTKGNGDLWEATIPKTLNGVYIVELTATDDAGNIAYIARYILTIDITKLRVKLQQYPYNVKVKVKDYYANIRTGNYYEKFGIGNYYEKFKTGNYYAKFK